jgi:hypothetical protein
MEAGTTPGKGWAVNSLFGNGEIPAFSDRRFPGIVDLRGGSFMQQPPLGVLERI